AVDGGRPGQITAVGRHGHHVMRLRVPQVGGHALESRHHEGVHTGGGHEDAVGAVDHVVRDAEDVTDPETDGDHRVERHGHCIFEVVGGPCLRGHHVVLPVQCAVGAEDQLAISVVGHDLGHDVG